MPPTTALALVIAHHGGKSGRGVYEWLSVILPKKRCWGFLRKAWGVLPVDGRRYPVNPLRDPGLNPDLPEPWLLADLSPESATHFTVYKSYPSPPHNLNLHLLVSTPPLPPPPPLHCGAEMLQPGAGVSERSAVDPLRWETSCVFVLSLLVRAKRQRTRKACSPRTHVLGSASDLYLTLP
ncbi:hypothetical protein NHX12_032503 [Muraenolepis orangiensis]|uniref:Uncharacterized protein n=1 Tax=Muraenolepis orangiensis TaxID=630683 RepID=A0A9Q0E9V7_9TELE|nr:hypothetical protein NHX12_032503 [Muraenolepis orangiensis]